MEPDQQPGPDGGDAVAGWGGGVADVVAGLDLIDRGIELVLGASLVTLTVAQQRVALGRMIGLRSGNEAAYLHLLAQFDQPQAPAAGVTARRPGLEFLTGSMNYSKVRPGVTWPWPTRLTRPVPATT